MPANFLQPNSDAELIQQSRDGDESAYGQIVHRYLGAVIGCIDKFRGRDVLRRKSHAGFPNLRVYSGGH